MKSWRTVGPATLVLLLSGGMSLPVGASSGAVASAALIYHAGMLPADSFKAPSRAGTVQKNIGWASSNWSGYVLSGSTYTSISGSWIVPGVSATQGTQYSSVWIGIDGFNNSDLIQTGTDEVATSGGETSDAAWWEILPAAETPIPTMSISPGNHMTANIADDGFGRWTISITDVTTGQTFITTQNYTGPGQSAEWILEAPEVNGTIASLAHYSETTVQPTSVNGESPDLVPSDAGVMIQNGIQVSTPSNPNLAMNGFNVQYGGATPLPPP